MSAWTSGAAVLTAVFPMLLFITVAAALYVLYTKPETVPGRPRPPERPVSYTAEPGRPQAAPGPAPAQVAQAQVAPAQVAQAEGDATAQTSASEAARTEDAE